MSFFSIVIPVYNKQTDIKTCLDSVLSQKFKDFEVIIIDDGSTDKSASIIKEYLSDSRVKYIFKENGGVSSARNRGIKESSGEWICFMDADDIMYATALEEYNRLIKKYPEIKVVVASVDQTNKKYPTRDYDYVVNDYCLSNAKSYARTGFSLVHTDCICVRKEILSFAGGFNENYSHGEDMDLWYRISKVCNMIKSDIPVALYKIGTENSSEKVSTSNRRYAPIAVIDRPRSEFKRYSEKLLQGERIFFNTFPGIIKAFNLDKLKLFIKYMDWTLLFGAYTIYYRVIRR